MGASPDDGARVGAAGHTSVKKCQATPKEENIAVTASVMDVKFAQFPPHQSVKGSDPMPSRSSIGHVGLIALAVVACAAINDAEVTSQPRVRPTTQVATRPP